MNELTRLALELQTFCEDHDWKFCVIGGLAVQHWGEPRFTKDVDLTLLAGFGGEEAIVDEWLARYEARIADARAFSLVRRVLLLRSSEGIGIDVALGALPFEESAIARSKKIAIEKGAALRLCSAEDLIVMKAFASRPLDWHDIRGILVRQGTRKLNWSYVQRYLRPLCDLKDAPEIMAELERIKKEVRAGESRR